MITVRLKKPLAIAVDLLAKKHHTKHNHIIREAIICYLEDNEDLELAKTALKRFKTAKPLAQLRKDLNLDN
jgi:RHH-type rel operon transcriptional repressor/antitoxin RelB